MTVCTIVRDHVVYISSWSLEGISQRLGESCSMTAPLLGGANPASLEHRTLRMENLVWTEQFAVVIGSGGPTGWMVGQDVSWLGCIQNPVQLTNSALNSTLGGHFEEILLLVKLHNFSSWVTLSKPHIDKLAVNLPQRMIHKWLANSLYNSLMETAKKVSYIIFYLCLTHSS